MGSESPSESQKWTHGGDELVGRRVVDRVAGPGHEPELASREPTRDLLGPALRDHGVPLSPHDEGRGRDPRQLVLDAVLEGHADGRTDPGQTRLEVVEDR